MPSGEPAAGGLQSAYKGLTRRRAGCILHAKAAVRRRPALETTGLQLALSDDPLATDRQDPRATAVERYVRVILVAGFLAVLSLEAYLIWEGLSLL
jgi:hypothetical protein